MKLPVWLAELHRQWRVARGKRMTPAARPFARRWEDLLDAAKLDTAADRNHAEREAASLEAEGRLILRRHHYRRHLIESVAVPLDAEPWLIAFFGGTAPAALRDQSIEVVTRWRKLGNERWPESWEKLCDSLLQSFGLGKSLRPFPCLKPDLVGRLLSIVHGLSVRTWPEGTLVRGASEQLGLPSKALEEHRTAVDAALGLLMGEPCTLEALGIICHQSHALICGDLIVHFQDGTFETPFLNESTTLDYGDLMRATHITTSAKRLLTIENTKTTFRQAVARNRAADRDTLLVATSFPNQATQRLLNLLPAELPHYHFGDVDAAGFAILRALRECTPRTVRPFVMDWKDDPASPPLSEYDRRVLPGLLAIPLMADCRVDLERMQTVQRKGRFEQEARGAPGLDAWPFWAEALTALGEEML